MRNFVSGHPADTTHDFLELALGTPVELWLGVEGESEEERGARLDAARDILADYPELPDRAVQVAAKALDEAGLLRLSPLPVPSAALRRSLRTGVAA
ncbi:hypothetical protein PGH47_29005 [Streptomyces sp. HUAS 31]|nr:hypothetical protein [Streptomyces sp. HUAS 31]WCE02227.1 hypothetical protein PGH47_29005 [Streptomyces sp. HUAS 31]